MKKLLLIILLLISAPSAWGADLYVTPVRPAAFGNGSLATPFRNMSSALTRVQPGDTIKLMAGVHGGDFVENSCTTHCAGVITTWVNGTTNNPITITSYPNPLDAKIDGNGQMANCIFVGHQNYIIDGLELRNCEHMGIQADGHTYPDREGTCDLTQIYGNVGEEGPKNPVTNMGGGHYCTNGIDNLIIRNNYIHDCKLDAVKAGHGNNVTVENNNMHNVSKTSGGHSIMQMNGIYGGVVRNNWMHDDLPIVSPHVLFFMKGGSKDIVVENNLFENAGTSYAAIEIGDNMEWYNIRYTPSEIPGLNDRIFAQSTADNEIMPTVGGVYANSSTYQPEVLAEARNIVVRGNIIKNAGPPLSARGSYNVRWYNNTAIDSSGGQASIKLWTDGYNGLPSGGYNSRAHVAKNQKFYNNLFVNLTTPMLDMGSPGQAYYIKDKDGENYPLLNQEGLEIDYNQYYNMGFTQFFTTIGTIVDTHAKYNFNPNFDSTYHPATGNVAATSGGNLRTLGMLGPSETWVDRDGVTRPTASELANGYSVGALLATGSGGTQVNGDCGSSNGGTFSAAPTTNLCSAGTATSVSGTGIPNWTWGCNGLNGGTSTAGNACNASYSAPAPASVANRASFKCWIR